MRARRAEDSEEEEETSRARDDLAYHEALMRTPLEELAYVTAQTTGRWPRDLTEALRSDRAGTPDLMVLENQLFEPRHRILRRRAAAVPAAAVPVPAAAVPARPWSGLFPRDVAPWSLSRPPGVLSFALDRPLQPTAPSTTSAPNHVGFNLARARSPPGGPAFDLS